MVEAEGKINIWLICLQTSVCWSCDLNFQAETKKEPANEKKVEEPSKQNDGAVSGAADLDDAIHKQGDLIRELKVAKTSKASDTRISLLFWI